MNEWLIQLRIPAQAPTPQSTCDPTEAFELASKALTEARELVTSGAKRCSLRFTYSGHGFAFEFLRQEDGSVELATSKVNG